MERAFLLRDLTHPDSAAISGDAHTLEDRFQLRHGIQHVRNRLRPKCILAEHLAHE